MRSVVIDAPGAMREAPAEVPAPAAGEALVRVDAAGICAGDLYIYRGKNPYVQYPCVAGHEIAGTVVESGERVVVEPFLGCGACYPCRVGKSNCCANLRIIGVHRPGGYAQFLTAPASHLHPIPDGLSSVRASFAEPLAIAIQAFRRAQLTPGEEVLILGAGPIGLALVEVALAYGALPRIVDPNAERRATAAELGAEPLADARDADGAPVVVEATGVAAVIEQAVELVAPGGRVVVVGLVPRGTGVTIPGLDITRKEITLLGSRASVGCFPEALRLLASDAIRYPDKATELSLWDAPRIFADLAENPASLHKGVLLP